MNLNSDNMHGPNPNAFGHSGAGGSTGFADPDHKLGIGYAMNQMDTNLDGDTRAARLTRAVYDALQH
jgi:CubicO group peptidase (beta-lactamase class C family)